MTVIAAIMTIKAAGFQVIKHEQFYMVNTSTGVHHRTLTARGLVLMAEVMAEKPVT